MQYISERILIVKTDRKAILAELKRLYPEAGPELDFAFARAKEAGAMVDMAARGALPLRVTHNDTKLNNVMIDLDTDEGVCVIDLDTVMPGSILYDFGDSIRSGANPAAEDEKDLGKVDFSLPLYEEYIRGFLSEACLTETELENLAWGARLMTYECGMRFLTDYLDGDLYYRTNRPGQNLDRARTQLKLLADMEKLFGRMRDIAHKNTKGYNLRDAVFKEGGDSYLGT